MKLRTSIYSFLKIILFSCDIGKKIKIHVLKALFLTKKQTKTKQQTKNTKQILQHCYPVFYMKKM